MIIVEKWRRRVEKACQSKAQEVCISLTNDYETKLQSVSIMGEIHHTYILLYQLK